MADFRPSPFERLICSVDAPPFPAVGRIMLGVALFPAFDACCATEAAGWRLLPLLLVTLVALRIVPAIARQVLPFSSELCVRWSSRRVLAKQYDSYQWRKLFWLGIGQTIYICVFRQWRFWEVLLAGA